MNFRKATAEDLPHIVKMMADDTLGEKREDYRDPLPETYYSAFRRIAADPHQELIVVEDHTGGIVGTLQLSFIPYLTYQGGIRAQVEAVRVRADKRGKGIGERLLKWAIDRSREKGAHLLQLTTDKERPGALRFYEKLGFKASHTGMKLHFNR